MGKDHDKSPCENAHKSGRSRSQNQAKRVLQHSVRKKEPLDLEATCDKLSYLASQSKVRDGIIELYKDERSRPIY